MYYNFGRVRQTLRVTPAVEAGVSDHVWELQEIVGLPTPPRGARDFAQRGELGRAFDHGLCVAVDHFRLIPVFRQSVDLGSRLGIEERQVETDLREPR